MIHISQINLLLLWRYGIEQEFHISCGCKIILLLWVLSSLKFLRFLRGLCDFPWALDIYSIVIPLLLVLRIFSPILLQLYSTTLNHPFLMQTGLNCYAKEILRAVNPRSNTIKPINFKLKEIWNSSFNHYNSQERQVPEIRSNWCSKGSPNIYSASSPTLALSLKDSLISFQPNDPNNSNHQAPHKSLACFHSQKLYAFYLKKNTSLGTIRLKVTWLESLNHNSLHPLFCRKHHFIKTKGEKKQRTRNPSRAPNAAETANKNKD